MTATCSGSGLRSAFATFAPSLRPRKLALRRPSRRRLLSTEAGNGNGSGSGNNALIAELESRGLLQAMTSSALPGHLSKRRRAVYAGVDPSAASLHVGNLLPLLGLLHFALHGHTALALIGGATGAIGDPSGRSSERTALSPSELAHNVSSITSQLREFFERAERYLSKRHEWFSSHSALERTEAVAGAGGRSGAGHQIGKELDVRVVNNLEWFGKMGVLDFLRVVGKHARVGTMMARDSVKNRLVPTAETDSSTGPPGLSFTEFSYQLLQAHDFSVLHNAPWDCSIQLGGSDQMGNIMAGVDLIRRQRFASATASSTGSSPESVESENTIAESPAYGLTLPLLTTSSGAKFGKSAGNAIWLSNSLLGDYDFYQFFLRTTDADVSRYLRALTLLPLPHIEEVLTQHGQDPARRIAQRALADSVTEMVRGETGLERAKVASKLLFEKGGDEKMQLKVSEIVHAFEGDSRLVRVQRDQAMGADIVKLAALVGVCKSKGEARRQIQSGGLYLNDLSIRDVSRTLTDGDLVDGSVAVLRVGKTGHRILVLV